MFNPSSENERSIREKSAVEAFLESSGDGAFASLFKIFTPQLVSFFRARGCDCGLSEDLAQDVMLLVYRRAHQLRDRALFRSWMFKIARNALRLHYRRQCREVETIEIEKVPDRAIASSAGHTGTPAFEFLRWIAFLDTREQEALRLRFVEQWEYHEIAAAQSIPIGTIQWRVFNAKKKLVPRLKRLDRRAA